MSSTPEHLALHGQVVAAATRAPSVHNTQPWRFTSYDEGLDLWADPQRQLAVLDPDGRQLHLSCGAALQCAVVAARALGLDAQPRLLPDPSDPTHLARLRLATGAPPTEQDVAAATAITLRHTHRGAFDGPPLPAALLEELRLVAEDHGAWLRLLQDQDDLLALEVLLSRADDAEQADPAYRAEVAGWLREEPSADGIARAALPEDPERGSSLRLRDFTAGTGAPREGAAAGDPPIAEHPDVMVLLSRDDSTLSWLLAGRALGAVLLRAAQDGVMAQPLGQVTDATVPRERLADALGLLAVPQLVLRLGHTSSAGQAGRRELADVWSPAAAPEPASRPGGSEPYELDRAACLAYLRSGRLGRVVLPGQTRGLASVLPVDFVLDGERVVLRTGEGTILAAAREGGWLTFQTDAVDDTGRAWGWSVTVAGHVYEATGSEHERLLGLGLNPTAGGARTHHVVIPVEVAQGRRVGGPAASPHDRDPR